MLTVVPLGIVFLKYSIMMGSYNLKGARLTNVTLSPTFSGDVYDDGWRLGGSIRERNSFLLFKTEENSVVGSVEKYAEKFNSAIS